MKGERLPTTEQFRHAKNCIARALGWLPHIEASTDAENEGLRTTALSELSAAAENLGFELAPRAEGKDVRSA